MSKIFNLFNKIANYSGRNLFLSGRGHVLNLSLGLRSLNDEELKERCESVKRGEFQKRGRVRVSGPMSLLLEVIPHRVANHFGLHTYEAIALGIECFARAPADLPEGSRLYPEQIGAALSLMHQQIIQMNTGEGKTYALLPAAFAHACENKQVIILCANEYLAYRDASRTRRFWEYVGITHGFVASEKPDDPAWGLPVIYTTARKLINKHLHDEISDSAPKYPLMFNVLLLDDADAILLDQSSDFSLVQPIKGEAFDWSRAIDLASEFEVDQDVTIDRGTLIASLTVKGEKKLRELDSQVSTNRTQYYRLRYAVEAAIGAINAEEMTHYIVQNNRCLYVDPVTTKVEPGVRPLWLQPLSQIKNIELDSAEFTLNQMSLPVLLKSFRHLSGVSGTVIDESFEYLCEYMLLSVIIPPRRVRHKGLRNDLILRNRREAIQAIVQQVEYVRNEGRPILIGAQTILEASKVYDALEAHFGKDDDIRLLTGMNESDIARIIRGAGSPGAVLVATQLAGRGVDIRITSEVRELGGMYLISLGHALDLRHDRQFLGRAGRQGDPYDAVFICSLEDSLMQIFGGERIRKVVDRVGVEDGEVIKHPFITKAIQKAQQNWRAYKFFERRTLILLRQAMHSVKASNNLWFEYLQTNSDIDLQEDGGWIRLLPLLEYAVESFLDHSFGSLSSVKQMGESAAIQCLKGFSGTIRVDVAQLQINSTDLEARTGSAVRDILREECYRLARESMKEFQVRRDELINILQKRQSWRLLWKRVRLWAGHDEEVPSGYVELAFNPNLSTRGITAAIAAQKYSIKSEVEDEEIIEKLAAAVSELLETDEPEISQFSNVDLLCALALERAENAEDEVDQRLNEIVEKLITGMAARLGHFEEVDEQNAAFLKRDPVEVALWTLRSNWLEFLQDKERIEFLAKQRQLSNADYFREVTQQITLTWAQRESNLGAEVVSGLVGLRNPAALEDRFLFVDHVNNEVSIKPYHKYKWEVDSDLPEAGGIEPPVDTIKRFLASEADQVRKIRIDKVVATRLMLDFLSIAPVHSLREPKMIQHALDSWARTQSERGLCRDERKRNKMLIRAFLIHLRSEGMIGPLPGTRNRLESAAAKARSSLIDVRTILYGGFAMVMIAVFVAMALFGKFGDSFQVTGLSSIIDKLFAGGLFARGSIAAAAFPPLVLGVALWGVSRRQRGAGIENILVSVCGAFLAFIITPWSNPSSGHLWPAVAVSIFIATLACAQLVKAATWNLENQLGVSLVSGWLSWNFVAVFMPGMIDHFGWTIVGVMAAVLTIHLFVRELNNCECCLLSSQVTAKGASLSSSDSRVVIKIRGNTGISGHGFATLFTVSVFGALGGFTNSPLLSQMWRDAILIACYISVSALWILVGIRRKFALNSWRIRLSANRQVLEGAETDALLENYLRQTKARVTAVELSKLVAMIVLLCVAYWGVAIPGAGYPLSLLLMFAGVLFAEHAWFFLRQLRNLIFGRIVYSQELLNMDSVKEYERPQTWIDKLKRLLDHRLVWVLFVVTIVVNLIGLAKELYKLLVE